MKDGEITLMIMNSFPELKNALPGLQMMSTHAVMSVFTQFMRKQARIHQIDKVSQCMKLAGYIHAHSASPVKASIENEFVYAFSQVSRSCDPGEWNHIRVHMPPTLYTLYIKQVIGYGT